MSTQIDIATLEALERRTTEFLDGIRTATRVLRTLTPLAAEMRVLLEAMDQFRSAVPEVLLDPDGFGSTTGGGVSSALPAVRPARAATSVPTLRAAAVAPPAPATTPAPQVRQPEPEAVPADDVTPEDFEPPESLSAIEGESGSADVGLAEEDVSAVPLAELEPEPGRKRTVSVTVTRADGPLDLVKVHSALDQIPGVSGLALASYTRGRAAILLDTERQQEDLPLREALLAAFPEGVSGRWVAEGEYLATIGATDGRPAGD